MKVLESITETNYYTRFSHSRTYTKVQVGVVPNHWYVCEVAHKHSSQDDSVVTKRLTRSGEAGNKFLPTPYRRYEYTCSPARYIHTVTAVTQGYNDCQPAGRIIRTDESVHRNLFEPNIPGLSGTHTNFSLNVGHGLRALAIQDMYEDAKHNKMQLGETLAELTKSVQTISLLAKTLANSYFHMRRGNFREAINVIHPFIRRDKRTPSQYATDLQVRRLNKLDDQYLKRFANNRSRAAARKWLAWHYGVLPIVHDIDSLHQLYHNGLTNYLDLSFRSTGFAGKMVDCSYTYNSQIRYNLPVLYRYKVGAIWRINDIGRFNASQIGFAPADVPRLLWALVPGSFIVDWLVDIDGFLSSLSVSQSGLTYVRGYETQTVTTKSASVRFHNDTVSNGNRSHWDVTSPISLKAMTRVVTLNAPMPLVVIKNPFSLNHATTIVAILNGAPLKGAQQR